MAGKNIPPGARNTTAAAGHRTAGDGPATNQDTTLALANQEANANPGLEFALWCLERGLKPVPLCWPNERSECACGHRRAKTFEPDPHKADQVGKAPLISGWNDPEYNPDEAAIRRWAKRWPGCNWGIVLRTSGLLHLDPDSPEALADVLRRGTGVTVCRQSKNPSYLYRFREPDGAARRKNTTHQGEHGRLDVLVNGLAVAFGRHRKGHEIYLIGEDFAESPAWAVDMLPEQSAAVDVEFPADLPVVDVGLLPISPALRRLIREGDFNRRFPREKDPTLTDRSGMLWVIEWALIDAGCDDATIAGVVLDQANKGGEKAQECGRDWLKNDLSRCRGEYADTVRLVWGAEEHEEPEEPAPVIDDTRLLAMQAENDQLRALVVDLAAALRTERAQRTALVAALKNPHVRQEAPTILAIGALIESRASRGLVDEQGRVTIYRGRNQQDEGSLCAELHRSGSTIAAHSARAQTWGLLRYETQDVRDPKTGELKTKTFYSFTDEVPDYAALVDTLAKIEPDKPKLGRPAGKRCLNGCEAPIMRRTTREYICTGCGSYVAELEVTEELLEPEPAAELNDLARSEEPASGTEHSSLDTVSLPRAELLSPVETPTVRNDLSRLPCLDCGGPLPPGRTVRCKPCSDALWAKLRKEAAG